MVINSPSPDGAAKAMEGNVRNDDFDDVDGAEIDAWCVEPGNGARRAAVSKASVSDRRRQSRGCYRAPRGLDCFDPRLAVRYRLGPASGRKRRFRPHFTRRDTLPKEAMMVAHSTTSPRPGAVKALQELACVRDTCLCNAQMTSGSVERLWRHLAGLCAPIIASASRVLLLGERPSLIAWPEHPLGRDYVRRMLRIHAWRGDVQTVAVVLIVLDDLKRAQEQVRAAAQRPFDARHLLGDNAFVGHKQIYADRLVRAGKPLLAAEIRQYACPSAAHTKDDEALRFIPSGGALECAICSVRVRGLSTFCIMCGHGGHAAHMAQWFSSNETCPVGGCRCKCQLYRK